MLNFRQFEAGPAHHAQAISMAAMVPARTSRPNMRLLAERITVSQRDEIALMRHWLETRHEDVPAADAHRHMEASHMASMPGMLNEEELASLDSGYARGHVCLRNRQVLVTRFDRASAGPQSSRINWKRAVAQFCERIHGILGRDRDHPR